MSMQKMRENTKTILWIVVIAFIVTIFAVWGMDLNTSSSGQDPNIIGKVNNAAITRQQFQQVYDQMLRSLTAGDPDKEIPYSQREILQDQAWNTIIYNILTQGEIKKLGIRATDEEIRYYLRNTPPPEIQQYFLDESGNFDYQAYQAALNNPDIDWTSLENLARDRIPMMKLQTYLQAMVHVSSAEVRRAYEEDHTKLTAVCVEFPLADIDLGGYNPAADEIEAYYNSHQDEFQESEKAILDIAAVDIKPAERDLEAAKYIIDLAWKDILSGEDFSKIAQDYSESPTASSGGETGFLARGQREEEFFEAADSLKAGKVSKPIKTVSGYYLIKLLERKTSEGEEEFNTQEIFVKISPGYETVDSLQLTVQQLYEKAKDGGLKNAAAELNINVVTTKPFLKNYPIEGFGYVPRLNDFAFSSEEGTLGRISRDDARFYLAYLSKKIPETVKPLDEIKEIIVKKLEEKKRKEICSAGALNFYNEAKLGDFEETARKRGLEIQKLEDFHVSDNLEKFGPYSALATAAFSVAEGALTPPIHDREAYFVVKLLSRTPIDEKDYQNQMASIGNRLYQQKVQQYLEYWYSMLEKNGKIEDYRGEY